MCKRVLRSSTVPYPCPLLLVSGEHQCLDAFIVALGQACEGGKKRWYTSTMELQLVSLEFCRACRSVPTLHVPVKDSTPRSLWPPQSQIGASNAIISSRVPAVRAIHLTGELPMLLRLQRAEIERWICCEYLHLQGSVCAASLLSVVWPRGLKHLVLESGLEACVETISWPPSLRSLACGGNFNQSLTGMMWPVALQQLWLGHYFNQPIAGVDWPASLRRINFGKRFNQPITTVVWPSSLQQVTFGKVDDGDDDTSLPPFPEQENLELWFQEPITAVWPDLLEEIQIVGSNKFNQSIAGVVWPAALQRLAFREDFNQPITGVVWPKSR